MAAKGASVLDNTPAPTFPGDARDGNRSTPHGPVWPGKEPIARRVVIKKPIKPSAQAMQIMPAITTRKCPRTRRATLPRGRLVAGFMLLAALLLPGVASATPCLIGGTGQTVRLTTLDGQSVSVPDGFAGSVTILNFWASWCFPCRYEMPLLQRLQNRYGDQGLRVLAIAVDDSLSAVRAYQDKHGFSFAIAYDGEGVAKQAFGVRAVPESLILDRQGCPVPVTEPATGTPSTRLTDPTLWEGDSIHTLLQRLLEPA